MASLNLVQPMGTIAIFTNLMVPGGGFVSLLRHPFKSKQINKTNITWLCEPQVHSQEAYKLLRF